MRHWGKMQGYEEFDQEMINWKLKKVRKFS